MNETKTVRSVYRVVPGDMNTLEGGKFIKQLRVEAQRTQEELANLADISMKELSRIETGKNDKVSFETIVRLALCFDIPVQDIAAAYGVQGLRSFSRKGE